MVDVDVNIDVDSDIDLDVDFFLEQCRAFGFSRTNRHTRSGPN